MLDGVELTTARTGCKAHHIHNFTICHLFLTLAQNPSRNGSLHIDTLASQDLKFGVCLYHCWWTASLITNLEGVWCHTPRLWSVQASALSDVAENSEPPAFCIGATPHPSGVTSRTSTALDQQLHIWELEHESASEIRLGVARHQFAGWSYISALSCF